MDDRRQLDTVARGRDAAARGVWREAYDLLATADPADLSAEDLELIGEAASWSGPTEQCIHAHERAYRAYVEAGNHRSAARLALALVRDYNLAHAGSVATGWASRAERLLADQPDCPEQGYLARRRAGTAEARGDIEEAERQLDRALDVARRFGDRELEVLTRHDRGCMLVRGGDVAQGWALIDEAAAAAAAGDLRPTAAGTVYCRTISACRDLLEVGRAGEWTARFEQWCDQTSLPGGWRGDCRVHRAEVLRLKGRWSDAEREVDSASADFLRYNMPGEAANAVSELGELKRRRGDFAGAADAFRRALEAGADPQPGLGLLRLAQGKADAGFGDLSRALADAGDDRIERARLLPAFVELAVATGRIPEARAAATELADLASLYGSGALHAAAALATGSVFVAGGEAPSAVQPLREAVRRWHALDAPYEAARARMGLAEAYESTSQHEAAVQELEAAQAIFERLGAVADARRAAELLPYGPAATTATFMFSDIVGSTALVEAIGDDVWADLIGWHDRTLRAVFREHGGEEVDHAGDGFFVAFGDPGSAMACAIAIQRALAEHRRGHGFAPSVRIGVHITDAIRAGGGYRGKGIHTAARIAAAASGNEIVASRETAEAARQSFTNVRSLALKGLSAPVVVVTVDWA